MESESACSEECSYYQIRTTADIDYSAIVNDFDANFDGKKVVLATSFKRIPKVVILFKESQLPHLMGWEKLTGPGRNLPSSEVLSSIISGKMTLASSRSNANFNNIKDKMMNYNYLHQLFINHNDDVIIYMSDAKPNKYHLDIIFQSTSVNDIHKHVILGCRKDGSYFYPTTLQVRRKLVGCGQRQIHINKQSELILA